MKKHLLIITALCTLLISCGIEKRTVKKSIKHEAELLTIAQKIFAQYSPMPTAGKADLEDLDLTAKEKRLVHKKLKFENITAVYEYKRHEYTEVKTDSVVIFSRSGVFNSGADIVVDMHKIPLGSLPCNDPDDCFKLSERIYSIRTTAFINNISATNGKSKTIASN